jgi:NADH dehydrogenase
VRAKDNEHHVVILGCGFGGLFAARALKRAPVQVTVIDRTNHHLFQPLLYQVATGILSEGQIAPPIRDVLEGSRNLQVVLADVHDIDAAERRIHADRFGQPLVVDYDSLIVACGSATSYFGQDQFRTISNGMKTLADALTLRGRILGAFELAEAEADGEKRRALMTFVIVGGGPTGVEMAGQLCELSRRALPHNYRGIDTAASRVVLVEGGDSLVSTMGARLSRYTARKLQHMGVEVHLNTMVTGMDSHGVTITKHDGSTETIEAFTKVWAAGTKGNDLGRKVADSAGAEVDRAGRVKVQPDCSLATHPEVFVVGDLMALDNLPGVAEVAMQSGAHAAHSIRRRLAGKDPKPFHYRDLGTLAVISRFTAVAKVGWLRVSGFLGWLIWLVVHITFLTGFKNRVGALARWAVSFIGRGRSERALVSRSMIGPESWTNLPKEELIGAALREG